MICPIWILRNKSPKRHMMPYGQSSSNILIDFLRSRYCTQLHSLTSSFKFIILVLISPHYKWIEITLHLQQLGQVSFSWHSVYFFILWSTVYQHIEKNSQTTILPYTQYHATKTLCLHVCKGTSWKLIKHLLTSRKIILRLQSSNESF